MSNFTTAKQVTDALAKALITDVASYIREVNTDSVVSRSHLTLRHLYLNFGKDKTDAEVSRQFYVADYIAEERTRGNAITEQTTIDARDAFDGGAR